MVVGFPLLLHSKWETWQHGLGIPSPPSSACGFDAGLPDHAPPQGCRKVSLGPGRALDAAPSCVPLLRPPGAARSPLCPSPLGSSFPKEQRLLAAA